MQSYGYIDILRGILTPEKDKTAEWHSSFCMGLLRQTGFYGAAAQRMQSCLDYYNGTMNQRVFPFLQQSEDGSALPATWKNLNRIKTSVDTIVGEVATAGLKLSVTAVNGEAVSRKAAQRRKMTVGMKLKPFFSSIEEEYDIELGSSSVQLNPGIPPVEIPDSLEDIDDYMNRSFKDLSEVVFQRALDIVYKRNELGRLFPQIFRDIPIMGRAFTKVDVVDGFPRIRKVDPRNVAFDPTCDDDFMSNCQWIAEIRMVGVADLAAQYNLSHETLSKLTTNSSGQMAMGTAWAPWTLNNSTFLDGSSIVVTEMEWYDLMDVRFKLEFDEFGAPYVMGMPEEPDESRHEEVEKLNVGEAVMERNTLVAAETPNGTVYAQKETKTKFVRRKIRVVRRCVIAGPGHVLDYGLSPFQGRMESNLSSCAFSYSGYLPNYVDAKTVSIVDIQRDLQDWKDMNMYNLQLTIARSGARGVMYNMDYLPEGYSFVEVANLLKNVGIVPYSGGDEGVAMTGAMFQNYDLSIPSSINSFLAINQTISSEMELVSGVSMARQGQVQGAEQAVGVTQIAVVQSTMNTQLLTKGFKELMAETMTKALNTLARNQDSIANLSELIGDAANIFLDNYQEYAMDYYGVFVTPDSQAIDDRNQLTQLVYMALQQQAITIVEAGWLLSEQDTREAFRRMERLARIKEKRAMEQQAQQMEMQRQAQQTQAQTQLGAAQIAADAGIDQTAMNNEASLQQAAMTSEASINAQREKLGADVERALAVEAMRLQGRQNQTPNPLSK